MTQREQLETELAGATAELRAHMATWEYAFSMAGGCHGGREHPALGDPRADRGSTLAVATSAPACSNTSSELALRGKRTLRSLRSGQRLSDAFTEGGDDMADNRGVAYMGTGKVEVQDIDFPTFELKDGPGVNPDNVGRQLPARGDPQGRLHQHLRLRPAHGPRPHDRPRGADPRPRDHRRGDRGRAGTSSSSRSATSARCRSTSPAAAAATARRATPASA